MPPMTDEHCYPMLWFDTMPSPSKKSFLIPFVQTARCRTTVASFQAVGLRSHADAATMYREAVGDTMLTPRVTTSDGYTIVTGDTLWVRPLSSLPRPITLRSRL